MAKIVIPVITIGVRFAPGRLPRKRGPLRALCGQRCNLASVVGQVAGGVAVQKCGDGEPCAAVAGRVVGHVDEGGIHAAHC